MGNLELSKNAMTEFFSNLSMQALSRSNDSVLLNFEAIEKLVININSLFGEKIDYFIAKK